MIPTPDFTFTVAASCTKCSACSHVCPSSIIAMTADGPTLPNAKICIKCGHCVAVCPVAALDFSWTPLKNQTNIEKPLSITAEEAEQFLRSRRSIRSYRKLEVPTDKLEKILNIAHYAPTGGNSQSISYIVIKSSETIKALSNLTLEWIDALAKTNASFRQYANLSKISKETGSDMIFRGAPAAIVAVGPRKLPMARDNARFNLAYAELFAPTLGLGTCWAGFFEMSTSEYNKEVYDILGLTEEQMVVGALMVGYPKYHYKRLVDRNPLKFTLL